jgi:hypothetical protein|tara:strand:+ start:1159 stop:1374 length:216 start_codon:yes stop_codon:yes gene_type:complete
MTKITLDEVEYESENFNDLQNNLLSEINYNNNVQTQLNYQLQSVRTTANILVGKLKDELTNKPEETEPESE